MVSVIYYMLALLLSSIRGHASKIAVRLVQRF